MFSDQRVFRKEEKIKEKKRKEEKKGNTRMFHFT